MLFKTLLINKWRAFWRAPDLIAKLIFGGLGLLFVLNMVVSASIAGFFLDELLTLLEVEENVVQLVHRYAMLVLLGILGLRFIIEKGPQVQILPYLTLPYSRQQLARVLSFLTFSSGQYVAIFVFFVAFTIGVITPAYGAATGMLYLLNVVLLLTGLNFLVFMLRGLMSRAGMFVIGGGVILLVVAYVLFTFTTFSAIFPESPLAFLSAISSSLFSSFLTANPLIIFGLLLFCGVTTWAYYRQVLAAAYVDATTKSTERKRTQGTQAFVPKNRVQNYLYLDWKMLTRNRHNRQQILSASIITFIFGFQMLLNPEVMDSTWLLIGLLLTGVFVLQYGPLMQGFEGHYFDGLLAANFNARAYITAKIIFLGASVLVFFLLWLVPFWVMRPDRVLMLFAFFVYNLGANAYFALLGGIYSANKALDLNRSVFMNYSTVTPISMFLSLPVIALPGIIRLIAGDFRTSLFALILVGLIGILAHIPVINFISRRFEDRKHKLAEVLRIHA